MNRDIIAAVAIGVVGAVASTAAHHSFAAEFDRDKPVKVEGTVTKVEWTNPHIWFYVDVKDADGKVTNWGFSGAPPGVLMHRGIGKTSLKIGDVVKVEGFRARDQSNNASGDSVTFADGRKVFTASAEAR
jgi:hypothetical protein